MLLPRRFAAVWFLVIATFAVLLTAVPQKSLEAAPAPGCVDGVVQSSGAKYRICMPKDWNRKLVIYAHGFVAPQEPIAIPENQLLLEDVSVPGVINGLGYAFATTSYRKNGLAILEGIEDVKDLTRIFVKKQGKPSQTFLVGPSEGGLVTTLAIERNPKLFDGGIAACGPIGDFPKQINYLGDVRVIFDYYFPGVIPGGADAIPHEVVADWETVFEPAIIAALNAAPDKMALVQKITGMPRQHEESNAEVVTEALWYNVHATEDATETLGGFPYDNATRVYRGSADDPALNAGVARFSADAAALIEMKKYQTSGKLQRPLVTLHTTRDPVVPYFHEGLYASKVRPSVLHRNIAVRRDGHCGFEVVDALAAFGLMQLMAGPAQNERPTIGTPPRD